MNLLLMDLVKLIKQFLSLSFCLFVSLSLISRLQVSFSLLSVEMKLFLYLSFSYLS